MSTGVKQADGTYCYSKNPAKCKNHKPQTDESFKNSDPFKAFEAAMAKKMKNPANERMLAAIMMVEHVTGETKARRERTLGPVKETITGLRGYDADSVAKLKAHNAEYAQLVSRLDKTHLEALHEYTGIVYSPVNRYLTDKEAFRRDSKFPDRLESQIEGLEEVITSLDQVFEVAEPAAKPRTLYRVIKQKTAYTDVVSSEEYGKRLGLEVGKTVEFPAYTSTSIDPHIVPQLNSQNGDYLNVTLIITTRKGVPVGKTAEKEEDKKSTQDSESEILLPRNSRFTVTGVTNDIEFTQPKYWADERDNVRPVVFYLEEVE
jgi:hypothetical protein